MSLRRAIVLPATLLLLAAGGAQADETAQKLFGYEPDGQRAAACFARVYDAAHLAAHPQQNVTDMKMLVDGQPDDGGTFYLVGIHVHFRGLAAEMGASGGCGTDFEGKSLISCGIECDGGTIGIRMRDATSVLVDIPDGARTWSPDVETDDEGNGPPEASFGADDKTFRLDRVALSECRPLAYDETLAELIDTGALK